MRESRLVHLDFRLCLLEEHRRLVEVAAHIQTEAAAVAAGRSSQEEVPEAEEGEGSCTGLT